MADVKSLSSRSSIFQAQLLLIAFISLVNRSHFLVSLHAYNFLLLFLKTAHFEYYVAVLESDSPSFLVFVVTACYNFGLHF